MGLYVIINVVLILIIVSLAIKLARARSLYKRVTHQFDETSIILDSLRDGLIECDQALVPTRVNHATETMLGIEASSIVGRSVNRQAPANASDAILAKILFTPKDATNQGGDLSYDVYIDQTNEKKLRVFTIPKTEPVHKTLTGYIKIIRDVTIEEVVDNHKSDLISIVSHQLLTPLTGLKWILKSILVGDGGVVNEKQASLLRKGLVASEGMISLVDDILDVTKIEQAKHTYKKDIVNVNAFMQGLITSRSEKAKARNITIKYSPATNGEVTAVFDKERLGIALDNILDNALDYSRSETSVELDLSTTNDKVRFTIKDGGIGIPDTAKTQLFTKFYRGDNAKRVRTSGTGLGLYIAKHIIEDQNGTISVSSEEGKGSTFTIEMPLVQRV